MIVTQNWVALPLQRRIKISYRNNWITEDRTKKKRMKLNSTKFKVMQSQPNKNFCQEPHSLYFGNSWREGKDLRLLAGYRWAGKLNSFCVLFGSRATLCLSSHTSQGTHSCPCATDCCPLDDASAMGSFCKVHSGKKKKKLEAVPGEVVAKCPVYLWRPRHGKSSMQPWSNMCKKGERKVEDAHETATRYILEHRTLVLLEDIKISWLVLLSKMASQKASCKICRGKGERIDQRERKNYLNIWKMLLWQ